MSAEHINDQSWVIQRSNKSLSCVCREWTRIANVLIRWDERSWSVVTVRMVASTQVLTRCRAQMDPAQVRHRRISSRISGLVSVLKCGLKEQ